MRGELEREWPTRRRDLAALAAVVVLTLVGFVQSSHGGKVPLLGLVDLGFHELGHLITYVFPDLVTAMAGSFTQVLVPVGLGVYFMLVRNERSSAAVCLAWAATSAFDVAVYVADAPFERLQLIGGEHDWAYALSPDGLDVIDRAGGIATGVRALGVMLATLAVGLCVAPLVRLAVGHRWLSPGASVRRDEDEDEAESRGRPTPVASIRWTEPID